MSDIDSIKELAREGYSDSEIQRLTGRNRRTIRKYREMKDFSPKLPIVIPRGSIIDDFEDKIKTMLEEEKNVFAKQRYTARRIHELLMEDGFRGSYSTVQRRVRQLREESGVSEVYQELVWPAGEAQVDFGEADFLVQGIQRRLHFLVVTFPQSNISYAQVFFGETAECVCQGLMDIFLCIGGVPTRLIFDNAAGVGHRIGEMIRETELFRAMKLHFGFSVAFCNPYAGHEKGCVENAVGTIRSNLFVPIPAFDDIEVFNVDLLLRCWERGNKMHYKRGENQQLLFENDRNALLPLPADPFLAVRHIVVRTNKKGMVQVNGPHYYSTRPDAAGQEVFVRIGAHWIEVYTKSGSLLARHRREFGKKRTDTVDPGSLLSDLCRKPGAWHNSYVRASVDADLQAAVDTMPKQEYRRFMTAWSAVNRDYNFDLSVEVMNWFVGQSRIPAVSDALSLAERMRLNGLDAEPSPGQSLTAYDKAFLKVDNA